MTFDIASSNASTHDVTPDASPQERLAFRELARHSSDLILREQHEDGAYPAAPSFSAYAGYCWLRDSSFVAEAMSRAGQAESATRFHDWACGVLVARREKVAAIVAARTLGAPTEPAAMLPTRFTYSGADGAEPWWNFQTDGYGMWLWSAVAHAARHGLDLGRWRAGLEVAADYINALWDQPCYDWWEEHVEQRHVSTLGALYAGLMSLAASGAFDAARTAQALETAVRIQSLVRADGVADGHLTKWLGHDALDASLAACIVPFGLVARDEPLARATLRAIAADLDHAGGVHRFRADVFYGGGQWLLLSALLGWNAVATGDRPGALRYLRWIATQASETGDLPEQVADHLLHPDSRDEWTARWGEVASPLLWSHGMYLILAAELGLLAEREEAP